MATWNIHRTRSGTYQLTYRNWHTKQVVVCGETHGDTPTPKLIEWIVATGDPAPGDLIVTPDDRILQVFPSSHRLVSA